MKSVFLFLVLTSIFYYIVARNDNPKCNKRELNQLDVDVQKVYIFGSPNRHFPTNDSELKKFCSDNTFLHKRIKEYTSTCLDKSAKHLVGLITYSLNHTTAAICKSKKRSNELIKLGACGNAAKNETIVCWKQFVYSFEGVKIYPINNLKFPLICCNFYELTKCNVNAYDRFGRVCNEAVIDGLDNLLNKFAIETLNAICGDYIRDNDKCDKIIDLPPKPTVKNPYLSPLLPFIEILKDFD